jgi:DNA-binding beta-propeller fold protein YncE
VYQASTWDAAVKKFSPSGQLLSSFGSRGSGAGQFNDPLNVAVDSAAGVFYVADAGNNRVQKWTTEGRLLAAVPVSGRAYRVTLDPAGTVWAFTDTGLYHISAELKVMDQVATKNGRGEVIAFDASGNLYMADPPLIYQVSPSGTGQSWGSAGGAPGQFSSWIDWLAVDSQGRIYVLDHGNKRIQQFTP